MVKCTLILHEVILGEVSENLNKLCMNVWRKILMFRMINKYLEFEQTIKWFK